MSKIFKRIVLGISAALVAFVFLGGSATLSGVRASAQAGDDGAYREMGVFEEVLKKVQSDYVVDPKVGEVTDGALHGLLESLDSDSSYLTPAEYKAYKEHLNSGVAQIGLVVSKRFGYATVVTVEPGSPADKDEIEDGDILEAIEGQSTREMSLAMIRLLLEGKPGTTVTFSLVRPRKSEPDKVTLTRSVTAAPALNEQQYENSSILYLRPGTLTKDRVDDLEGKLKGAQKSGKKVLLDLRDVAEGDEAQGVRLANAFLQTGTIATLEGQKVAKQTFTADPSKFVTAAQLIVLVNHGTAGAAELAAAAILDNKRGKLVGDRTFGEGTVQKTFELPDGGAVILTVAKYDAPSGKSIQEESVTPNVLVASNDDQQVDQDSTEETGVTGSPGKPVDPNAAKPGPKTDDQLNKALELLKTAGTSAEAGKSPAVGTGL